MAGKIFEIFEEKRSDAEGVIEIQVISAYPITETQKSSLTEAISRKLGKKVEVKSAVDESLIGGAVIRAGDSVIDASIKGRLQDLKNIFAN